MKFETKEQRQADLANALQTANKNTTEAHRTEVLERLNRQFNADIIWTSTDGFKQAEPADFIV